MEHYRIDQDIKVLCISATSYPEGIEAAHRKLHSLVPFSMERGYFGISFPNGKGGIEYKAAASELHPGEAKTYGCETFLIKAGNYLCETIPDYQKDLPRIGKVFESLLSDPRIASDGYCLEVYLNEHDMRCMVPLETSVFS
jgi:hypothetical protein